jgi:hypothetical protein
MARQKKAENAYELLERVCEAIKASPINYGQDAWCFTPTPDCDCDQCKALRAQQEHGGCGTAFCRAGWIVALHDGHAAAKETDDIEGRAVTLLGLGRSDTDHLFDGSAVTGKVGTVAYVRKGIAGVRAFMKQHAAHLKARSLRGV